MLSPRPSQGRLRYGGRIRPHLRHETRAPLVMNNDQEWKPPACVPLATPELVTGFSYPTKVSGLWDRVSVSHAAVKTPPYENGFHPRPRRQAVGERSSVFPARPSCAESPKMVVIEQRSPIARTRFGCRSRIPVRPGRVIVETGTRVTGMNRHNTLP
jgi:hypothetical protein